MPLRATTGTTNLHAFEFEEGQWEELKATYKRLGLTMPCCQRAAVPKTSPLGNYFFAHARKGPCATAPESAQHLYCKQLIAQAAHAAGWTVTTERPGACPTGEAWIADVFCERGRAQVAFEVQMSPQPHAETLRRQRRYRDSGVRGAWFHAPMKSGIAPLTDKETPVFSLEDFEVGVPPRVKGFPLALPEFVEALLGKRLTYEVPEYTRTLHVGYLLGECWTCKRQLKHVCGMLDSAEQPWWYHPLTAASLSQTLAGVQAALSSSELAGLGLNRIEQYEINLGRRSKAPTSNICLHCNAPQPNEYVTEKLRAALGAPGELKNPPARVSSLLGAAVLTRTERGAGRWKLHDAAAVPSGHLAA